MDEPVLLQNNYRLEIMADGFSFPTSLTFDPSGAAYVVESGLSFGGSIAGGQIWKVHDCRDRLLLAQDLGKPVNGCTFHDGKLYVSEGDHPGRIIALDPDSGGQTSIILDGLPGPGNYHTNMVAFGPDGRLYFSQGAMTNTGIVGLDAYEIGWLRRLPHAHDIPGYDIVLAGVNVTTTNPLADDGDSQTVVTGAFAPFGTRTKQGRMIKGQVPCTAAIMRCNPDGSELELVAWGLRNAYGIGFLPDGRLIATDQGADDRGSRPVGNAPDLLYEVRNGAWYGWPDFIGGEPVTDPEYAPKRGARPKFMLANHKDLPPPEKPLLRFPQNSAAVKFDIAPARLVGLTGKGVSAENNDDSLLYIALFGDERPMTAPSSGAREGRAIACIDYRSWTVRATISHPQLQRPIDVRYNKVDGCLYILDFGKFEINEDHGINAEPKSGKLWRLAQAEG